MSHQSVVMTLCVIIHCDLEFYLYTSVWASWGIYLFLITYIFFLYLSFISFKRCCSFGQVRRARTGVSILYLTLTEELDFRYKTALTLCPSWDDSGSCSDRWFLKRQQMEDGDSSNDTQQLHKRWRCSDGGGFDNTSSIFFYLFFFTADSLQQQHLTTLSMFSIHKSDYFWKELCVLSSDQFIWVCQTSESFLNSCIHPNRLDQIWTFWFQAETVMKSSCNIYSGRKQVVIF